MWLLCDWVLQSIVKCFGAKIFTNGHSVTAGLSCCAADVEHFPSSPLWLHAQTNKASAAWVNQMNSLISKVAELCLCFAHFKLSSGWNHSINWEHFQHIVPSKIHTIDAIQCMEGQNGKNRKASCFSYSGALMYYWTCSYPQLALQSHGFICVN